MEKKRGIRPFYIFIGVLIIVSIFILYDGLFMEIIPHSRRLFGSYEAFRKQAEPNSFPKKLPASAQNMKYYVYEGMLKDKSCYYVKLSSEDYEAAKQERFESYSLEEETGGGYRYKGGPKKFVSLEQMEENRIDFLGKIIPEEEAGQYYFLCSYFYESDDTYNFNGVLCNDETCEMVELQLYGPQ